MLAAASDDPPLDNHRERISNAIQLPAGPDRDAALLSALRSISTELVAAEEHHARSANRVAMTKQLFDWAASALSGHPTNHNATTTNILELSRDCEVDDLNERLRKSGENSSVKCADEECSGVAQDDNDNYQQFKLPASEPIPQIPRAISGGGLSADQVIAHRDAFYRKLCNVSPAELSSYTPPPASLNMKSQSQIDQDIYIATHWETGTESIDVMEFRRRHKTFYTKMKLSKANVGRRMGHHIREIAASGSATTTSSVNGDDHTIPEIGRRKAFCQYGKNDESLMYLSVDELYDAIFEIHCITAAATTTTTTATAESGENRHRHRPTLLCKKICNMRYANIPQDQIKAFVDTCPVCASSKRSSSSSAAAASSSSLKRQRIVNLEE